MGRMQGVSDQHHVAVPPMLVPDPGEIAPHRPVRDQWMTVECCSKDLLAAAPGLVDRHLVESVGLPGRAIAFDQERAHVRRVAIMMWVERAAVGRDEGL